MKVVSVYPAEMGWEVRSDTIENDQIFVSGSKAEMAARRLAKAIAHAGDDVSVQIHLRDGALAGTRMVWAEAPLNTQLADQGPSNMDAVIFRPPSWQRGT